MSERKWMIKGNQRLTVSPSVNSWPYRDRAPTLRAQGVSEADVELMRQIDALYLQ